jgi:hypothetical protein
MEKVVFIGRSSESLQVAESIGVLVEELSEEPGKEFNVIPKLWKDAFPLGKHTLESLEEITNDVSGAVFVFNEDDKTIRGGTGKEIVSVRDNVIFEFGLFLGRMSRERVIIARSKKPEIASDLSGITYLDISDAKKLTAKEILRNWVKTLPTLGELSNMASAAASLQSAASPQSAVSPPTQASPSNSQRELKIGKIERFGNRDWRVLDIQDGKALLLCKQIWNQRPYHRSGEATTWKDCTLRKELNDEFYNQIPQEERTRIAKTRIVNRENEWYGTDGGEDFDDFIFLLSLEEVDQYFGDSGDYAEKRRKDYNDGKIILADDGWYLSNDFDKERVAMYKGKASWWWLRSPGYLSNFAANVTDGGAVDVDGYLVINGSGGVRPALWLNL